MSEQVGATGRPTDKVGRLLYAASRGLAIIGGFVLCAMALMTTASVTGRTALSEPIPGDFELVAIGTGLAVFAFLPYCQMVRGNVIVGFFMNKAPTRAKTICDVLGGLIYLFIGALLTWRMALGGLDMHKYAETTLTISFPRWSTFPISVLCMSLLVLVTAYTVGRSIAETRANHLPAE